MTAKGHLAAALSLVSCALFLFVGCGTDPRPVVLGPGVVTPGSSPSEPSTPAEDSPSASASSSPTPTDSPSPRVAPPSRTPSPTPSPTSNPDAVCGGGSSGPNSGPRFPPFRDDDAEIDAEDQRGDGRTVDVEDVQLSRSDGFVVVCWRDMGQLLGSARVARSNNDHDLQIDLDERIIKTIRLAVVLYADTNGDGRLDSSDRVVSDDDYQDIDDLELEFLTYRYAG